MRTLLMECAWIGSCALIPPTHDITTIKQSLYVDHSSQAEDRKQFRKSTFDCLRSALFECERQAREEDCKTSDELKVTILQALDFLDVLAQEDQDDWCDEGGAIIQKKLTTLLDRFE